MAPANQSQLLSRTERLTAQFYEWEIRGRGWQLWERPVQLEPTFYPFTYHFTPRANAVDDAHKPTKLSSLVGLLFGKVPNGTLPIEPKEEEELQPYTDTEESDLVELQVSVPATLKISKELTELFLFSLDACMSPVAVEYIGKDKAVTILISCRRLDSDHICDQLKAYFPEVTVREGVQSLQAMWQESQSDECAVVDLGLANEFMLPLALPRNFDFDPLIAIVGALSQMRPNEIGLVQVLFSPVRNAWASSVLRSVSDDEGGSFFADAPYILKLAREKVSRPLYAVTVRLGAQASTQERSSIILRGLAGTFSQFSNPSGNEFIPLSNRGYSDEAHIADVLDRRSRRNGMFLNSEELACLAHLPSASVRSLELQREGERTKAVRGREGKTGLVLGQNIHAGQTNTVSLGSEDRLRHTYVLGASGTGKSTFLLNCIVQDIQSGQGFAVLDPHGDLIDRVLEHIPEERHGDVVLLDPSDEEYPVGFNILSAHSELEKTLLSSDLVSVFRRLSTSWGDQMTSVLGNALLAFLESTRGGTLVDLRRFLVEPQFRAEFLETVTDSDVLYFWRKEFPLLSGKPQAPLLTRLDTFLRPKLIRRMVGQRENKVDFRHIMDSRKIFLAKLSQGAIGEENAYLFGTLLVAKLHQTAIGRQDIKESERKPFYLYIDEFQNFITPSMASILSGARKYGLGLILAHQDLRQLWNQDTQVANAVISNPHTRICFRLGDFDAEKLKEGFSFFTASDLQNLSVGEAICRIERAEYDFNLKTLPLPSVEEEVADKRRRDVVAYSRSQYTMKREDVEQGFTAVASTPIQTQPETTEAPFRRELIEPVSRLVIDLPAKERRRETKPTPIPTLPGRGGAQHKYLQQLVKRMAEAQGYRATIEKEVLGGSGKIDVALERSDEKIACEISVSTTGEHEFGNVQKCIAAGYSSVIVLATDKKALTHIQQFISDHLDPKVCQSVVFLLPEEFSAHIEQKRATATSSEQTVRGYRVKVNYRVVSEDEKKAKKTTIAQVVTQSLRQAKQRN